MSKKLTTFACLMFFLTWLVMTVSWFLLAFEVISETFPQEIKLMVTGFTTTIIGGYFAKRYGEKNSLNKNNITKSQKKE